jgi:hypothetical protein
MDNYINDGIQREPYSAPQPESYGGVQEFSAPQALFSVKNIQVEPLNSGYVLSVGCQRVAIQTLETLIDNIKRYLEDPQGVEKAWNEKTYVI